MGHGSTEVASHGTMMTNIQRNPTIPMTKRDSLLSNGTRVSLLANGSNSATPKKFDEKDYVNTNPNMVAGKKRSPKLTKVKRTPSYKIATNRQSVDDLDGIAVVKVITDAKRDTRSVRTEDRTKYNTLPRTDTVLSQKKPIESRRRKHETNESRSEFERTASQKSGTYPSPDTDEDQWSIQPDRKKKSTFKRMKERLILTFKRDRDHETEKGVKSKGNKYKSPTGRVKPNQSATRDAFNTPNDVIEMKEGNNNTNHITKGDAFVRDHRSGVTNGGLTANSNYATPQSNKGPGIFKTIRNSFRRKQAPTKIRKGKGSAETSGKYTSSSSQPNSGSSLEREGVSDNNKTGQKSQPIDIHPAPVHMQAIEEQFIDADDSITEIFGSLIDPEGRTSSSVTPNFRAGSRPDTSKLRLEGLKKCKPRSFDRTSPRSERHQAHGAFISDLSPTVEIDGFDYADAPPSGVIVGESDLEYGDVCQHEQQRRVDDVAKRLAAIGDSIASRIESESAGSSEEFNGFRVGSQDRRLSQLEQELLTDLRRFGDEIDGTLFARGNKMKFSTTILPIICNIVRAQDYSTFRTVIHREISNTVGWEQVAWYTYIMKATMDLAGAGKTIGTVMKNNATRYFSSTIKPWIQSQPSGWESIHEESDTECEVD
ncbi:uncharacterized protein LOC123551839 isoform X2 [Mercenaria mercenaria]|uniref:uncharacterized protein LOC123551839 isoform X2 n=1 Tax=Mercenaria mercenaria TaxID=6596 RepID=UPI00234EEE5F|nr:uncharacterized protein LOC123551839 isoform X2 [Mercenaria mercenaria]